jgi:hypothetical protein
VLVNETRMIEIPEFPVLRGQEAIDALNEIVKELKEHKDKELTVKQAKALTKFANGLILSIQAEMSSEAPTKKRPKHAAFLKKFEDALSPVLHFPK